MSTGSTGDISGQGKNIITKPENYDEMVEKLTKREQAELERALEKHDVETLHQLEEIAKKTLTTKEQRKSSEYKPLKDRTVLREPQSEQVQGEKKRIEEETSQISQKILSSLPPQYSQSLTEKKVLGKRKFSEE